MVLAVVGVVAVVASLAGAGSADDEGEEPTAGELSVERGEGDGDDGSTPPPTPAVEEAPLDVVGGSWETLQQAPLEPRWSVPVAVGDALFVWGGAPWQGGGGGAFFDDGAVLRRKRWELLPPSPLEGRSGAAMAALDDRVVVWGGLARTAMLDDGAVYDLSEGRWRSLPPAPLSPRTDADAVWTGEEVVVVGGRDNAGPLFDAAAYDPDADAWRSLPASPAADRGSRSWATTSVHWTGAEVVVEWATPGSVGSSLFRLDPRGGTWEPLDAPERPMSGGLTLVSGDGALVAVSSRADGRPRSVAVRAGSGWEQVAIPGSSATRDATYGPGAVIVDGRLYLLSGPQALVLDLVDRSWASLGDLPAGLRSQDLALVDDPDRLVVWSTTGRWAALWHPAVRGSG